MIWIIGYFAIGGAWCFLGGWAGAFDKEPDRNKLEVATFLFWPLAIPGMFAGLGRMVAGK